MLESGDDLASSTRSAKGIKVVVHIHLDLTSTRRIEIFRVKAVNDATDPPQWPARSPTSRLPENGRKQAHLDDEYHDTGTTICHMSTINDCVIIIALDLTTAVNTGVHRLFIFCMSS